MSENEDIAWHAGYAAGATAQAGFSAGYAQAERDIMAWLTGPGPDRDNDGPCRHVEHSQGYCTCAELAECISRKAHAQNTPL